MYKIVSTDNGRLIQRIITETEARAEYTLITAKGNITWKKELQYVPTIQGLLGPMYDTDDNGKFIPRFETQEAYDILSA